MSRSILLGLGVACGVVFLLVSVLPLQAAQPDHIQTGRALGEPALLHNSQYTLVEPDLEAVEFSLLREGVDGNGNWFQTVRMVIKPGGALADAAESIYGNLDHIDELFAALKQRHPDLRSPSLIPANVEAEITVDPRVAFVPKRVSVDNQHGATVYEYYNGARRTVYDPKRAGDHKGLSQVVDLPADRPTKTFNILEETVLAEVPAGVRIAYYVFQASDDLKSVVAEIYGSDSTKSIHHFLSQTRWDPNHWPPAAPARDQRLVIPLNVSFADDPLTPLVLGGGTSVNSALTVRQAEERARKGVYAVRRQPYGTVFRVIARDFEITARQVATLLYGHDGEYLSIVAQAGFGSDHDLAQSPPPDVRLFGRSFEVLVDYEDEWFLAQNPTFNPAEGKLRTELLNGTVIEEWRSDPGKAGLLRQITLPSGHRKLLYRPQTITTLAGQILFALVSFGQSSGNPELRGQEEGGFVTRLIWDWGRSIPHRDGEVFDFGRLITVPGVDEKNDQLLEIAVRPAADDSFRSLPFYRPWLDSPFVLGIAAVLAALVSLGTFGWLAKRV